CIRTTVPLSPQYPPFRQNVPAKPAPALRRAQLGRNISRAVSGLYAHVIQAGPILKGCRRFLLPPRKSGGSFLVQKAFTTSLYCDKLYVHARGRRPERGEGPQRLLTDAAARPERNEPWSENGACLIPPSTGRKNVPPISICRWTMTGSRTAGIRCCICSTGRMSFGIPTPPTARAGGWSGFWTKTGCP